MHRVLISSASFYLIKLTLAISLWDGRLCTRYEGVGLDLHRCHRLVGEYPGTEVQAASPPKELYLRTGKVEVVYL